MAQYVLSGLESMYPDQFGVVNPEHIYIDNDPTKASINTILNNIDNQQYTDEEVGSVIDNVLSNYSSDETNTDPDPDNPNAWYTDEEVNKVIDLILEDY